MTDTRPPDPPPGPPDAPSPFLVDWAARLAAMTAPPGRALDIAMGRGRHACVFAAAGFRVFGVDANEDAVRAAVAAGRQRGLTIRGWCADLTMFPLPVARFDVIVVTRYLQRSLFPALIDALIPGGFIVYETFTEAQRALGRRPTSSDHLLAPGELRTRFPGFEVLRDEEIVERDALARLVARKARV